MVVNYASGVSDGTVYYTEVQFNVGKCRDN